MPPMATTKPYTYQLTNVSPMATTKHVTFSQIKETLKLTIWVLNNKIIEGSNPSLTAINSVYTNKFKAPLP